jgi:hypothetical protein
VQERADLPDYANYDPELQLPPSSVGRHRREAAKARQAEARAIAKRKSFVMGQTP